MSNIDSHWHLWVYASVAKHFNTLLTPAAPAFVEGQDRSTVDLQDWFEIRVDGPYYWPICKNQTKLHVEINILASTTKRNAYAIQALLGKAQAAFVNDICCYRLGPTSDPANDGTHFGVLTLNPGKEREKIVTAIFGRANATAAIRMGTVEGHYRMFIDL